MKPLLCPCSQYFILLFYSNFGTHSDEENQTHTCFSARQHPQLSGDVCGCDCTEAAAPYWESFTTKPWVLLSAPVKFSRVSGRWLTEQWVSVCFPPRTEHPGLVCLHKWIPSSSRNKISEMCEKIFTDQRMYGKNKTLGVFYFGHFISLKWAYLTS